MKNCSLDSFFNKCVTHMYVDNNQICVYDLIIFFSRIEIDYENQYFSHCAIVDFFVTLKIQFEDKRNIIFSIVTL